MNINTEAIREELNKQFSSTLVRKLGRSLPSSPNQIITTAILTSREVSPETILKFSELAGVSVQDLPQKNRPTASLKASSLAGVNCADLPSPNPTKDFKRRFSALRENESMEATPKEDEGLRQGPS